MSPAAATRGALGLLAQALTYTGAALSAATTADLRSPTPCDGWDLGRLLAHMEESLDAFAELASGDLALVPEPGRSPGVPPDPDADRVARIRTKACGLLHTWQDRADLTEGGETSHVHDRSAPTALLLGAAALEITVHGWDVHESLGVDRPIPDSLAGALMPLAPAVLDPRHFATPLAVPAGADGATTLLGLLGRRAQV